MSNEQVTRIDPHFVWSESSKDITPKRQCAIDFVRGSDGRSQEPLSQLLHSRLLQVVLLGLFPMTYFGILRFVEGEDATVPGFTVLGHVLVIAVWCLHVAVALILWRAQKLTTCRLRKIELVWFGSVLAFFSFHQFTSFCCPNFLRWSSPEYLPRFFHLFVLSASIRWFFVTILYGVFIPNRWERGATLISLAVVLPIVLTLVAALPRPDLRPLLLSPMLSMTVILLAGAGIGIFGASRTHFLHQQAQEARQLGQYRLIRQLGAGGMGEVWLAEHVLLRRPCAVKLIRENQEIDDVLLTRFEREVRAMAKLTHWGTVEVYDYGRADDGTFYYAMEYLPGLTLEEIVERSGPLPPGRVVYFIRQLCQALREAHRKCLLHRDIKPSNAIVGERGGIPDVVKLLDFGLVQHRNVDEESMKLTHQGTILGSPPFVSPEQARGKSDLTPASDVYGLGGMAYYLLTGKPPFVRETVMETLIAHATEKVIPPRELNPDVPEDLEEIVLRCLEKKPENRYQDVLCLDKALGACACAEEWTEEDAKDWWNGQDEDAPPETEPPESDALEPTTSLKAASV